MPTGKIGDDWGNTLPTPGSLGRIGGEPAAPGYRPATKRRIADVRRRNRAARRRARAHQQATRRGRR